MIIIITLVIHKEREQQLTLRRTAVSGGILRWFSIKIYTQHKEVVWNSTVKKLPKNSIGNTVFLQRQIVLSLLYKLLA